MRRFAAGLLFLTGGAVAGAVSAFVAIQNAGVVKLGGDGPWLSRIEARGGAAGIYVQSYYLLAGRLPAAPGHIEEATAERDSQGQALSASCVYAIVSTGALPQWWSLATLSSSNAMDTRQSVMDAATAVRGPGGIMEITAARSPQTGNWLKLPEVRQFSFLYLATPGAGRTAEKPPFRIERRGC